MAGKKLRKSSLRALFHGPDGLAHTIWDKTRIWRWIINSTAEERRLEQNRYIEPFGLSTRRNSTTNCSSQARNSCSDFHWLSQSSAFTPK
ncbi:hypothetical protein D3C73_1252840 [compost metagenome]